MFETIIIESVGHLALDLIEDMKDDESRVRYNLDKYDKIYNRDNGESIL